MGRLPRSAFKPSESENGVYLHLYNHTIPSDESLLGDVEKKQFLKILKNTLQLYSIDCLSAIILPSSYHLILYLPKMKYSLSEMTKVIKNINLTEHSIEDGFCKRRMSISNDLGNFMNELQRSFTVWFNKTRSFRRKGTLWASRYKCTKLTDSYSLIYSIKYIELSAVRQSLCKNLKDYPYASCGIALNSGNHPFNSEVNKHLSKIVSKEHSSKGAVEYLTEALSCIMKGKPDTQFLLQANRHWTNGVAMGRRSSLREYAAVLWGAERAKIKRFGKVFSCDDFEIYSMRQLGQSIGKA
jgi:hypothetical protein